MVIWLGETCNVGVNYVYHLVSKYLYAFIFTMFFIYIHIHIHTYIHTHIYIHMTVTFQLWTLSSVQCSKNTSTHCSVLYMSDLTQISEGNTISAWL